MAIGFGFNKAKVLSAAEKFVQQGKLQNAIAEYEKVIRDDPKDLTVLNTIGDLYARVGQNDKAAEYFRRVGDQYAQNGFVVKAIAIYKKLTKLAPATPETTLKLAELYTQQGLFNDARANYMQVANQLLKNGDNNQAARILQKVLELDPENAATQSKLADLYMKLGKKEEARSIYFAAAESLYARSSYEAADEALGKVLTLEPGNVQALQLRGMVASDAGNPQAAIQYLEQVQDLDSHPNALRALLRSKLATGNREGVESIANRMMTAHEDMAGMNAVIEWCLEQEQFEEVLRLYDRYADRFMARGPAALIDALHPLIGRIKNSPAALQMMQRVLQKAGDTSHSNEVTEMLAHAHVQSGDFTQARDAYKRLADLEPENPLHLQNYKQMLSKLGDDPTIRPLSAEEGAQAFMVEELVHEAPEIEQNYAPTVERAIEAALTDSELFASYNVPQKAIAPLEAALPLAPRDIHLNQRLATLYAKAERFEDAARVCRLLSDVYAEFGHTAESARYAAAADNYLGHGAGNAPAPVSEAPYVSHQPAAISSPPVVAEDTSTVQEFDLAIGLDLPEHVASEPPASTVSLTEPVRPDATAAGMFEVAPGKDQPSVVEEEVVVKPPEQEIDISSEWEEMISVEPEVHPPVRPEPLEPVHKADSRPPVAEPAAAHAGPGAAADPAVIADKIQEIQFYISQGFWDIAQAAIGDLAELSPGHSELGKLRTAVTAARAKAEEQAASRKPAKTATPAFDLEEHDLGARPDKKPETTPAGPHIAAPRPSPSASGFDDAVLDLPGELGEIAAQTPAAPAPMSAKTPAAPKPAAKKDEPSEDLLADFVLDLEESLGQDFTLDAGSRTEAKPRPAPPVRQQPPVMAAATNGQIQDSETSSALNDILSDLQHDVGEAEAAVEEEDPETHYNLGIAFKEMGLLDEAIGELQKVCHALDRGSGFSQPIQAYTWLAQCLVDKGVPEAAIRWYEKALTSNGLDLDSRCAIYYDLGVAHEASGDRKAALSNFMEVYSTNIDFRDVSTRIKALKS